MIDLKEFKEKLNEIIINNIKNDSLMLLEFISAKVKNYLPSTNQCLYPEDTGLDNIIWIQPQSDDKNNRPGGHSNNRIKVTDNDNPSPKNGIPIVMIKTIDDTNVIPSLRLSKNSKDKLRNWLEINNEDIHKVFDKKISVEKLRELSKRRKLADEKNLK